MRLRKPHPHEPLPEDAVAVRLSTLQIFGFCAFSMGVTMVLRNPSVELSVVGLSPGGHGIFGTVLAAFGAILTYGAWTRRPAFTYVGAHGVALWFFVYGVGFPLQWLAWRLAILPGPGGIEPVVYPLWPYICIAFALWSHTDVIVRRRRAQMSR